MKIEIWSDVVCPWCYVGKRNLEEALAGFDHRDEVEVVWRSYELDPSAPAVRPGSYADRLAAKYRVSRADGRAMTERMTRVAAAAGLVFRFDIARPGNTFDAHRLIHLGAAHGLQDAVKERLLSATFTEGERIGDRDTLARLVAEVGLDADEVESVLETDAYADDVRSDERAAMEAGVGGVPFFVVDGTYAISGAQPADVLRRVISRRWQETHDAPVLVTGGEDAPGCDDDSCAI